MENNKEITDKEKIQILKNCFETTIWMAIRYAHGKQTYAPHNVRDAVNKFKEVFPDWQLKHDQDVFEKEIIGGLPGDSLMDLFK